MDDSASVRERFRFLEAVLDERSRRLLAAAESKVWGPGGISKVSRATGVSRQVIRLGLKELSQPPAHPAGRVRRPGGGRKKAKHKDPALVADLEKLVEPTTRGHPETCFALDLQQRPQTGRGSQPDGTSSELSSGCGVAA